MMYVSTIKGHISLYLEVSVKNSDTPESFTEKVKNIGAVHLKVEDY